MKGLQVRALARGHARRPASDIAAWRAVPFLFGFTLVPVVVWSAHRGGAWSFLPLLTLYGLLPIADALAGKDDRNASDGELSALERTLAFRLVTWAWVPVHAGLLLWALGLYASRAWTPAELTGFLLSLSSILGAVGITFAHELVHRASRFERALGDAVLAMVTYPHWAVEHVLGHHRRVATPEDPASARLGEGYWAFASRALWTGLTSAWRLERERLSRRGLPARHVSNRFWRYAATTAVLYAFVALRWGAPGAAFFFAQGFIAVLLLEAANYVEHYGLARRIQSPGRYEPVLPCHSWDSKLRISNWMLINLARHADHHCAGSKRYQTLDARAGAPELPAGYGTMVVVALVPPLWRAVMDPRVRAARTAMPPLA